MLSTIMREALSWILSNPVSFLQTRSFLQALAPLSAISCSSSRTCVVMACRIAARRLASQLLKLDSACHEQVKVYSPARAFTTSAAKAQDASAQAEAGGSSKEQSHSVPVGSSKDQNQPVAKVAPRNALPAFFSPFPKPTSLTSMLEAMDRLFEMPVLSSMLGMPSTIMRSVSERLPWDVMEDEKSFKLRVDMPGFSKEEVKLIVEDGDLVIRAEYDAEKKEADWAERNYYDYNLRIKLPKNVELDSIKAEMKDGVLKVTVPKVEGVKQKQEVPIE